MRAVTAEARLNAPGALAFSADGTLYIADTDNNRIRSVNPASGTINTVAGGGDQDWALAESATAAALPEVTDLAVSSYGGTLYAASTLRNQVAAIDPKQGTIEILAGREDGSAAQLPPRRIQRLDGLWWPSGVDVSPDGTLHIADSGNGRIVAVDPHDARDTGRPEPEHVRVVAGSGIPGPAGTEGSTDEEFGELGRLAVDGDGSVLLVDGAAGLRRLNSYERTFSIAWNPRVPQHPQAIAVDRRKGTLFAADAAGNRVLAFTPGQRRPTVVAGTGPHGFTGDGGPANQAALDSPGGLAISPSGDLYIADTHNHRVRAVHDIAEVLDDRAG
ncbi:hypothetical protein ACFQZ2_12550 [Streptomonospora algeriensis]